MKHLLLTLVAGLLSGCVYTLAPHTPYLPVIRDQGQAEARLSTGFNGSELQLGYQVTDKLVLHTALLSFGRSAAGSKFRSGDLGLGYYYNSPNGVWRLGMHAGVAHGNGASGNNGCFECTTPDSLSATSTYAVRYTYGYVQPTVLLLDDARQTWGFGLRIGQVYYHQLDKVRILRINGKKETFDYAGHTLMFFQPTVQWNRRVSRWLTLSGTFGAQSFPKNYKGMGNINPFIGQVGIHFLLSTPPKPQP